MTSLSQDTQKRDLDLKAGANVYTAEGDRVGSIERVVLDPESLDATHLVVEKGLLFTKDRLVPVDQVGAATSDLITLRAGLDMDELEPFEVERYVPIDPANRQNRDRFNYRAMVAYPPISIGMTSRPTETIVVERTISDELVALEGGADVESFDGKVIGTVERVLTAGGTATHLVVDGRGLGRDLRAVPVSWIDELSDAGVRLKVEGWIVGELPDYEPEKA